MEEHDQLPPVSHEFIDENKLCKTRQSGKSGPSSKKDRFQRLEHVNKMHNVLGYSAVKIAELTGYNRNTVNSDIHYLDAKLAKEWGKYDPSAGLMKQVHRYESQRERLHEYLAEESDIKNKLAIERQISDIDSEIVHVMMSTISTPERRMDAFLTFFNKTSKENKLGYQLMKSTTLLSVADEDYDAIDEMIEKSKSKVKSRMLSQK